MGCGVSRGTIIGAYRRARVGAQALRHATTLQRSSYRASPLKEETSAARNRAVLPYVLQQRAALG
jgi:hypothetical protein